MRGDTSASPFQLASFELKADDDKVRRLKAAIERFGVKVEARQADGSATFTLKGESSKFPWNATGANLKRAVLEGLLSSEQDLEFETPEQVGETVKLLAASAEFARTHFRFLSGEDPKFPQAYFDENADLRPAASPAAAVRAIYKYADDVRMACRNCMQFAVLRSLIEVYGDEKFDRVVNSYRDTSKPFNILDENLYYGDNAAFLNWSDASNPKDIVPGQWVYALGNRKEGQLSGYEGSNLIVQPGLNYRSPWDRDKPALSLGDHLVDAFLYRYRWNKETSGKEDGAGRPNWSKWSNNDPETRELIPIDRSAPIPAGIRDFLIKTPANSAETKIIGGLTIRGILKSYRGTPRLLENPRPDEKLNR